MVGSEPLPPPRLPSHPRAREHRQSAASGGVVVKELTVSVSVDVNVEALASAAFYIAIAKCFVDAFHDDDPLPSDDSVARARVAYDELTAAGIDASDITHDALGGIAITVGAGPWAWIGLTNRGSTARLTGSCKPSSTITLDADGAWVQAVKEHLQ